MARLTSREGRLRRHLRLRKKIVGRADRPRLAVFRSVVHIYAQIIDDSSGNTLASASTIDAEAKAQLSGMNKSAEAGVVGKLVAERARAAGVSKVVFDRGGNQYHGRVKALAEAARAGGLEF